ASEDGVRIGADEPRTAKTPVTEKAGFDQSRHLVLDGLRRRCGEFGKFGKTVLFIRMQVEPGEYFTLDLGSQDRQKCRRSCPHKTGKYQQDLDGYRCQK